MKINLNHPLSKEEELNLVRFVSDYPYHIFELPIVTEAMCLEVLKSDASIFRRIENPTPSVCELAVRLRPQNMQHIKRPSEEFCLLAVENNDIVLDYIENPSDEVILKAVESHPSHANHLYEKYRRINKDRSKTLPSEVQEKLDQAYIKCVRKQPKLIQFIYQPSKSVIVEAVSQDGMLIELFAPHERTVEISMVAIGQNPEAVRFCKF